MVDKLELGQFYRLVAGLNLARWCVCDTVLPRGTLLVVLDQQSPNRVTIGVPLGPADPANFSAHKARRSTLRMLVEPADALPWFDTTAVRQSLGWHAFERAVKRMLSGRNLSVGTT